jgi:PAS domain S-box-containing protein
VEVSLAADVSQAGTLAIAAVRDVSDQRAPRRTYESSETRMRQLAEHVDTVFTLRRINPFAYLYVSPSFHTLTGIEAEEIIAHPDMFSALVHPDDRDRVVSEYLAAPDAGRTARSEHRIVRTDGEVRWVRAFATPVPNPDGELERVVTTTEDITDRMQAAAALSEAESTARAASEAKKEFLSQMSHELRTPLNAVLGFGQLLEHHLQETEHADSVRHIVRAGRHLLNLINEVLDIARIEAGELSMSRPEPVSVAPIVDEAALLMSPLAEAADVALVVTGGIQDQYVLADRQRLRQILFNLISNAVKYNRPGGRVWLSWIVEEARVSVIVGDDGPGIAPDQQNRLFTAFDRLGAEGTDVEGTGIRLTVTRGLAELMHGAVSVTSEVGRGSAFRVTLPKSEEPVACITKEPRATIQLSGAGSTISGAHLRWRDLNLPTTLSSSTTT